MGQLSHINKRDIAPILGADRTMPTHLTPLNVHPEGCVAVIFTSRLTGNDPDGYATAAAQMVALVAQQAGYLGHDSARGPDGLGLTISYWADEASARAWYRHPDHAAIRDAGRGRWYSDFTVHVSAVSRAYGWDKSESGGTA